jgi:alpha-L-fucosidase
MRKACMRKIEYIFCFLSLLFPMQSAVGQQRYLPNWESIDARPTPQWFMDAKFGIFICWGLYSVPAWTPKGKYAEWYQYWLQEKSFQGKVYDFHVRTYGKDFEFKDFAPMFKAELWDPDEWADLFEKAGAKYIVFTTKHHSGYTLWPSREAEQTYGENYNPVKVGPRRDIVGDLVAAIRKKNIKAGLYYSLYEWYHPSWRSDKQRYVDEHLFPQFKDLVTRYHPDIVWSDGEWEMDWEKWRSPELLAWLFNNAPNERDLVINDRWGKGIRHKHGGFYTTEYGSGMDDDSHPWEENRGMGFSYGYNRAEDLEDYRSAQELILMLIDVVSRGGNLCLDIGPRADGIIPVIMQERLLQIGAWLETNGEAIYGTRMWKQPCQWSAGSIPKTERKEYMSKFNILEQTVAPPKGQAFKEALFTYKNGNLYVIAPRWPDGMLRLKDIVPDRNTVVTFLETGEKLPWKVDGNNLLITTPQFYPNRMKSQYAYVFRLSSIEPVDK